MKNLTLITGIRGSLIDRQSSLPIIIATLCLDEEREMFHGDCICTKFSDLNYCMDDQIKLTLDKWLYSIRFDSYAYVITPRKGFDDFFILEGFNASWRRQYMENGFHKIDPIINKAQNYQQAHIWSSVSLSGSDRFLNCAKAHGIRYGYSMSLPINDQYIGVLSVARKEDIFVSQKESMNIIGMITVYLHKLNNQFLMDFNNKLIDKIGNLTPPAILTARERECLVWLAEGKTSWEISRILSISERTAVFHINNCMTKLGAKNRVQVIMKAMRANIIK